MCARFAQYRIAYEYLDKISVQLPLLGGLSPELIGRYNVPPQSRVQLLHQDADGLRMEANQMGYAPVWAQGKRPVGDQCQGGDRRDDHIFPRRVED
ncbi:hypothetical protein [Stutzerimonas azotifigens]|uniref:hypothetical protein n=1 Tax=Stutzerimonas azotifigens TaxID=291995 RepID=UPI002159B3AD|nr:hypothetical protein [Stutzerimonas azotifigens]